MTDQHQPGHRAVIEAALEDWWTTTDPAAPFHTPAVAEQVEMYLISSGYAITPDIPRNHRMPTRRAIATVVILAIVCAVSVALAAFRGDWGWGAFGTLGAGLLTWEAVRDITDRRNRRNAR